MSEASGKQLPLISIIVPVYNVSEYLRQALDSCLNQSFQNFEIICIDDCSTDGSLEILKDYAQKDSRIKVIEFKENHGQGYARNYALYNVACGEYVMFLDPDDWYEPDTFEIAYNKIEKNNNDFLIFGYKIFDEATGEVSMNTKYLEPFTDVIDKPDIKLYELNKSFIIAVYMWAMIYKKDFLIKNNIKCSEDIRIGEDIEFYIRAVVNSDSVSVVDKPMYNYRIKRKSLSVDNLYSDVIKARRRAYNIILDAKNDYMADFIPYYINAHLYWYKTRLKSDNVLMHNFYNEMRKDFIKLRKNYDIESLKEYIDYKNFIYVCKNNWTKRQLKVFIQSLFNVRNSKNKTHKEITICGFKIKLKLNKT